MKNTLKLDNSNTRRRQCSPRGELLKEFMQNAECMLEGVQHFLFFCAAGTTMDLKQMECFESTVTGVL